jgi:hypothetical protein
VGVEADKFRWSALRGRDERDHASHGRAGANEAQQDERCPGETTSGAAHRIKIRVTRVFRSGSAADDETTQIEKRPPQRREGARRDRVIAFVSSTQRNVTVGRIYAVLETTTQLWPASHIRRGEGTLNG